MSDMTKAAVTELDAQRGRRISRAMAARRQLDRAPFPARRGGSGRSRAGVRARAGGRVWVNGIEMGGTDPRHATLAFGHD
jgi:hypothetical protein